MSGTYRSRGCEGIAASLVITDNRQRRVKLFLLPQADAHSSFLYGDPENGQAVAT